jgi:hypothetical protein
VGTAICLGTASIIVGRFFLQRREMAEMMVTSGTGVGAVVMALTIYGLNRSVGLSVCLFVLSVCLCVCFTRTALNWFDFFFTRLTFIHTVVALTHVQ